MMDENVFLVIFFLFFPYLFISTIVTPNRKRDKKIRGKKLFYPLQLIMSVAVLEPVQYLAFVAKFSDF